MRSIASLAAPLFAVPLLHPALAAAQGRDEMSGPSRSRPDEIDEKADGLVKGLDAPP